MILCKAATLSTIAILIASATSFAAEQPAKQGIAKICTNCHMAEPGVLRGHFESAAAKAKTIQLKIDEAVELIKYDEEELKVITGAGKVADDEFLKNIKKGHEVKVEYAVRNGIKTAVKLIEKPPVQLPAEMLISLAEVEKLVALGPEKGKYNLFDSRPQPRFQEGYIPSAINLPYPEFDKMVGKLPRDKSALIIFYCAGTSCNMSPGSAEKAKKLGYTNIKVFKEGIPAWSERNYTLVTPKILKEAWIDKGIPLVLLDVRTTPETAGGIIKGAVAFPADKASRAAAELGIKQKKAPILLYDARNGDKAASAAGELIRAGYGNVKLLDGGFSGWQEAKYEISLESPSVLAVYQPKPKAGEVDFSRFLQLEKNLPPDIMVIDVRNADEVKSGMLTGAVNISTEELKEKAALIPKDKLVVTYCTTGVRAEMAYHALKELGYSKIQFLNAKVDFEKDGSYRISKDN